MRALTGRVAVVTGAASGIGLAMAERFVAEGMKVVMADIETGPLEEAVAHLRTGGADVLAIPTDVTDGESVTALATATFDHFGTAHLVCNNAGVGPGGITWELPESVWRWVLEVDLWGVIHGIRAFLPRLVDQGEGHVVNTASVAGLIGSPGMAPYSAAKHAVIGMSESLRHDLELAGSPVKVSVLCPAMTRSRMNDSGRNWPARLGPPPDDGLAPGHPSTRESFVRRMATEATDPAHVVHEVVEAVRDGRFWVVTEPHFGSRLRTHLGPLLG